MNAQDYWSMINPSEQMASADTQDSYRQERALADMVRRMREDRTSAPGYWSQNPELKARELAEYDERYRNYKPSSTSARSATEWVPDHKLNTYSNWAGAEGQPKMGYSQYSAENPRAQGMVEGHQPSGEQRRDQNWLARQYGQMSEIMPNLPSNKFPGAEAAIDYGIPPKESYPGEMMNYEHGTMSPNETPTGSMGDFLSSIAGGVGRAAKGAYDTITPSGVDTSSLQGMAEDIGLPKTPRMSWQQGASSPSAMALYMALNQPLDPISLALLAAGAKGGMGTKAPINPRQLLLPSGEMPGWAQRLRLPGPQGKLPPGQTRLPEGQGFEMGPGATRPINDFIGGPPMTPNVPSTELAPEALQEILRRVMHQREWQPPRSRQLGDLTNLGQGWIRGEY